MIILSKKRRIFLLSLAGGITFLCFFVLVLQFFKIQVKEHALWKKRAEGQHYFLIREPFRRGTFYANTSLQPDARQKIAFAIDVPLYHLYADSKSIPQKFRAEIRDHIIKLLNPPLKEALKIGEELARKSRSRRIISWLSEPQKQHFMSWWRPYAKSHKLASNALFFVSDFKRMHPMGRLLGQVLHTIQERRDYSTGKAIPTGGLEASCNRVLEGSMGLRRLMRSPHNSLETGEVLQKPVNGADVELTINHCLQAIVEEELEKGVKFHQAKGGIAVMVDPHNGHILALAQYPFFFPDQYQQYFNSPEAIEHSKIKALVDAHEPGSPIKALTVSLALKANRELQAQGKAPIFHPLEKIATSKGSFAGRSKPIQDVHTYSFLNMYMGVQQSSNIYMATIADRVVKAMGESWYRQGLASFGLGSKTGIELVGESSGMLPEPKKVNSAGKLEWSKGTPYTLSMGYNLQATALQMARAYCVFANGGVLPELTLVRKVIRTTQDGSVVEVDHTTDARIQSFPRVLHPDDVKEVVSALRFVTQTGGSATKADIFGYTEAGKTGTTHKVVGGQYSSTCRYASFVGFAPATNPVFVVFVGLDEPKYGYIPGIGLNHRGGQSAAPTFREIGTRALEFLGIPMDDPFGFPSNDPRGDAQKRAWSKEVTALNGLRQKWDTHGK
jgi:cell division protein FtsI (penicillin-binding protein 3)